MIGLTAICSLCIATKGLSGAAGCDLRREAISVSLRTVQSGGQYFPGWDVFTSRACPEVLCFQSLKFGAQRALRLIDGENIPRIPLGD